MSDEEMVVAQARELARARVAYARAFLLAKQTGTPSMPITDGVAHQMAIENTGDAVTVAQAKYDIAMERLKS